MKELSKYMHHFYFAWKENKPNRIYFDQVWSKTTVDLNFLVLVKRNKIIKKK